MTVGRTAVLLLALVLAACRSTQGQLSILVPHGVDVRQVTLARRAEAVEVEGRDVVPAYMLFPVRAPSLNRAVADATGGRKDVVLVSVVVERRVWSAIVYGEIHIVVTGLMMPIGEESP